MAGIIGRAQSIPLVRRLAVIPLIVVLAADRISSAVYGGHLEAPACSDIRVADKIAAILEDSAARQLPPGAMRYSAAAFHVTRASQAAEHASGARRTCAAVLEAPDAQGRTARIPIAYSVAPGPGGVTIEMILSPMATIRQIAVVPRQRPERTIPSGGAFATNSRQLDRGRTRTSSSPHSTQGPAASSQTPPNPTPVTAPPVVAPPAAPEPDHCGATPRCYDGGKFVATVRWVTGDQQKYNGGIRRHVTVTLRIQNAGTHPISLAYHAQSAQLVDNEKNRYDNDHYGGAQYIRGIGVSSRDAIDPQFTLDPGESGQAAFENYVDVRDNIDLGTIFTFNLILDEIDSRNGQPHVMRGHNVSFQGLKESAGAGTDDTPSGDSAGVDWRTQGADAQPTAGSELENSVQQSPVQQGGASDSTDCEASPRCFNAGRFIAAVHRVWASQSKYSSGVRRSVKVTVRIKNMTDKPLMLTYHAESAQLTDDAQNRYQNDHYGSADFVRGIGITTASETDPQFLLQPREWRDATFENYADLRTGIEIGTVYGFDLTLDQLDVMPSGQVRAGRSFAIGFHGLKESPLSIPIMHTGPCAELPACYASGPFKATVTGLAAKGTPYSGGVRREVSITMKIQNVSDSALILAYHAESQQLRDAAANGYRNDHYGGEKYVRGIGISARSGVDPSFTLAPHETREITLINSAEISSELKQGDAFSYDLAIDELHILPSKQIRVLHSYSVSFHGLTDTRPMWKRLLDGAVKPP